MDLFNSNDLTAIFVTLKLASITTFFLLLLGTPIAWWLSKSSSKFKIIIESLVALPLILPPTVLGFYFLIFLGKNGPLHILGIDSLAFSFVGLVIGSFFYSLPFVVRPLQETFILIGQKPLEVAYTLRASPIDSFFNVILPLSKPGFITATVLGFAHTVGEFGVVLMIGGNIPGKTQVISIAIFDYVESMDYGKAHLISASLLLFSFLLLFLVFNLNKKSKKRLQ